MSQLSRLMKHISATWVCDETRYPQLAAMSAAERQDFVVKHSLLHLMKTMGKIAAVCEHLDHGEPYAHKDAAELEASAVKLFVNVLKLADELGLSADDLVRRAPEYVT